MTKIRKLWRTTQRMGRAFTDGEVITRASSLSFTTVLTLVPVLTMVLALGNFAGEYDTLLSEIRNAILNYFAGFDPEFRSQLQESVRSVADARAGWSGFLILLWTASRVMGEIDAAIQVIWQAPQNRRWLVKWTYYWLFLVFIPVGLSVIVGFVPLGKLKILAGLSSHIISFFVFFSLLFFVYKFVPQIKVPTRVAIWTTAGVSLVFTFSQNLYVYLTQTLFNYSEVYGSLASLFLFLLWIFVIWMLFLSGVVFTKIFGHSPNQK